MYETEALEKAIVKIGYLLALGFGEAGSGIIGQNMTSSGSLDPMMPGKKTYAIFGFCILDHFVECTEVLQADIMTYVNRVAEIAHSMVDRYGGSTNKNIGEAFLMVWKFYNTAEIEKLDTSGKNYTNKDLCIQNQIIADLSVFSFLKIIAKLNKYEQILEFNRNEELLQRISSDFKCKMGFGIHQGWAIEGAIGSLYKIDASYLSPNVNMAARLEAATKQFGTLLLISGSLKKIMSDEMQACCREIDTVTVKGSIRPMQLFTIDICVDGMEPTKDPFFDKKIKDKKAIRDQMRDKMFQ
jgi:class 3 adenylate cyclase